MRIVGLILAAAFVLGTTAQAFAGCPSHSASAPQTVVQSDTNSTPVPQRPSDRNG